MNVREYRFKRMNQWRTTKYKSVGKWHKIWEWEGKRKWDRERLKFKLNGLNWRC